VAYAHSDDIKIIDLRLPSRSVTTSTVGPTLATAGLLVLTLRWQKIKLCEVPSFSIWP